MAKLHSWRGRIAAIVAALEGSEAAVLDRRDVEALFHLQRRAALRLMERFAPAQQGSAWRIERDRLLAWL